MTTTIDDFDANIAELIASVRSTPVASSAERVTVKTASLTSDLVADQCPSGFITRNSSFTLTAFTILEVIIAMSIGILILGVATLGISGIQQEHELRNAAADIESTARNTLLKAIAEHRPMQIGFSSLGGNVEIMRYGEKKFRKPGADEQWEFSPTGVCEPIDVRIHNDRGTIEMSFDPLTACARKKNVTVNHS